MFNKLYEKIVNNIKNFLKENWGEIVFVIVVLFFTWYTFPYYINAPGGAINLDKKIVIDNEYKSKGTFNMAYVSEYKANIFMLGLAHIIPSWDIYPANEYVTDGETYEEMEFRNKLEMQEAVDNAIIVAYKKANKKVDIKNVKTYVTYIEKGADTDLKLKDQIVKVNNKEVSSRIDIKNIINGKAGTKYNIEVINDGKTYQRYATMKDYDGVSLIGIMMDEKKDYTENPSVKFKFKNNESGPSGGLMTTLEIYDSLIEEDITHGKKIIGTGTINEDGSVGEIGGVKYKLKGAVNHHADIFFVPNGSNYDEAIKEKEKNKYKIEIIGVSSFEDALNYLNNK